MEKTYFTIYKITNKLNGKVYIGSHKTVNLEDGYMGSGKYLKRAIEKNGIENFSKEILYVFETPEEMFIKEAELVDEDFLATENTYNLRVGGFGGFDFVNANNNLVIERNRKISANRNYQDQEYLKKISLIKKEHAIVGNYGSNENFRKAAAVSFLGKKHTEITKKLIGEKNSKNRFGECNSNFGNEWITNGIENKLIKKGTLYPDGFRKGRKFKIIN